MYIALIYKNKYFTETQTERMKYHSEWKYMRGKKKDQDMLSNKKPPF